MSLKKVVIQVHLLLGLFIFPYLIIFGITSLNFNHGFWNSYEFTGPTTETKQFEIPSIEDNIELAEAIRDSLAIYGWVNERSTDRDSTAFRTLVQHPGKRYDIVANLTNHTIEIKSSTRTFIGILAGLHGLGEMIPGSPWWVAGWKYYQLSSVYAMIFWIVSGVYLWSISKDRKRHEIVILIGFTAFAILLMVWIWQG